MDTIAHLPEDIIEPRREIIRRALHQIAADLEKALRQAGLNFPVYLAVPTSGAYITFVTSADPTEAEWNKATEILGCLISERLSGAKLGHRELSCAAAHPTPIATEITAIAD